MKVYFCHYGQVYSMSKEDAIKFAEAAIKNGCHSFSNEYKSFRILKRTAKRGGDAIKVGKNYVDVHHCLDWNPEDWTNFLKYDMKVEGAVDPVLMKEKL